MFKHPLLIFRTINFSLNALELDTYFALREAMQSSVMLKKGGQGAPFAHSLNKQSVVYYTLYRRFRENTVATGR